VEANNALRIAGVLARIFGKDEITEADAESAIAVAKWCISQTVLLHELGRTTRLRSDRDRLDDILDDIGPLTLRDLNRRHGFTKQRIDAVMQRYPDAFVIEMKPAGPKGGRPSNYLHSKQSLY